MPSWNHKTTKANGIDVHYVRHGPDDGRSALPIVLLHGWPEFWYVWHKIIPELAKSFEVTRVSSQRTRSARASTSSARAVMSAALPIGVAVT